MHFTCIFVPILNHFANSRHSMECSPVPFKIQCTQNVSHCQKAFRFLFPVILEWDSSTLSFSTLPGGYRNSKYWPWIFVVFGIAIGTGVTSCAFTISHSSNFQILNVMFATILLLVAFSIFGCDAIMIGYAEDIVLAFNRMNRAMWELGKPTHSYHFIP